MLGFLAYVFEMFDFHKRTLDPYVKNKALSNAQFRVQIASELCIRWPLFVYTWGTKYNLCNYICCTCMSVYFIWL